MKKIKKYDILSQNIPLFVIIKGDRMSEKKKEQENTSQTVSISEFYDLWVMLARTTDALQCIRQNQLRQFGVSPEQLATLYAIISLSQSGEEVVSIAEISRLTFRQPHTVSEMIARLERMGLVTRTKISPNHNLVSISVTEEGYDIWSKAHDERFSKKIFSSLSKAKRERLYGYLEHILNEARNELGPNPRYVLRPKNR